MSTREPAHRAVAEPAGESYWSVDGAAWSSVRPGLPAHLVDLLAPPIVVGVARAPRRSGHHVGGGVPRSGPR
ncbi:hypothetical protein [Micromonospora pallida]|uniref:hypothetical protein n=1 Tax=Micromonospora pallida TaxID=145854 RepID=UPI00114D087E|nr:hypothetical protein [Micromonospora pallida]